MLKRLDAEDHFGEMVEAYRFAICLAAASKVELSTLKETKGFQTIFNVGTLDPDRSINAIIRIFFDVEEGSVYKVAERLADWGVRHIDDYLSKPGNSVVELVSKYG